MASTRSRIACEFSLESAAQHAPGHRVYLWTFTLPTVVPIREGGELFSRFLRKAVQQLGFYGVRVFELHPGGHGLHMHVVTNRYFHAPSFWGLARRWGIGRIDVQPIPASEVDYVAKYLTKSHPDTKGMRLWACFGGFVGSKVADIECRSTVGRILKTIPHWCIESLNQLGYWDKREVNFIRFLLAQDLARSRHFNNGLQEWMDAAACNGVTGSKLIEIAKKHLTRNPVYVAMGALREKSSG